MSSSEQPALEADSPFVVNMLEWTLFIAFMFTVAGAVVMWRNRQWPPLRVKDVPVLLALFAAGTVWSITTTADGFVARATSSCLAQGILNHVSAAMVLACLFVRNYRRYQVLINHRVDLWSPARQIAAVMAVLIIACIPPVIRLIAAGSEWQSRDPDSLVCLDSAEPFPPGASPFVQWFWGPGTMWLVWTPMVSIMLCQAWLNWRLRLVRAQLNEYLVGTLLQLMYCLAHLPMFLGWSSDLQALSFGFLTITLFWGLLGEAFTALLSHDAEYERIYTYGFSKYPSSSDLQASLGEQLTIPQIRKLWNRFATERHAQENLLFYEECTRLSDETGWFARQAAVMRILEKYVKVGARSEINISDRCRQRVLTGCINDIAIFRPAMTEVISMLHGMRMEFEESASVRAFQARVKKEEAEKQALTAAGLLPDNVDRSYSTDSTRSSSAGIQVASLPGLVLSPQAAPETRVHIPSSSSTTSIAGSPAKF